MAIPVCTTLGRVEYLPCRLCFMPTAMRYKPLQVAVCLDCAETAEPDNVSLIEAARAASSAIPGGSGERHSAS